MRTTDHPTDSDLSGRLTALAAHLDAERRARDESALGRSIDLDPVALLASQRTSQRTSRRPVALARAAAVMLVGAAGLLLAPRDAGPPPASAQAPSQAPAPVATPAPNPGPAPAPTAAPTPAPTTVSMPTPLAPDDVPPDPQPNPAAANLEPCPPPPPDLVVPDVVGRTYHDAEALLTEAGFMPLIAARDGVTHDGSAVVVDQLFVATDHEPCWKVVAVTFDSSITLGD